MVNHTVYAALTGGQGEIEARSEQFIFIKNGNEVVQTISNQEASIAATANKTKNKFAIVAAILIAITIVIAFVLIGYIARRNNRANFNNNDKNEIEQT